MKLWFRSALASAVVSALLPMPLFPAAAQSPLAERPEFSQLVPAGATVEKLVGDFQFTEGPAWNPMQGFLVFSDIPASHLYRYDAANRKADVFRASSEHANGNVYDSAGVLYTCEHGARRVTRQGTDGRVEVLVDRYEGKLFNSPNDIVVKHDGTIWFTDPPYGLEGRPREQATNNVYCFNPSTRELRAVVTDIEGPNGLCFSPDEKLLYIADSGRARNVRVFDVSADDQLTHDRVFCAIDKGVPDGMRCDRQGNLFSTSADSIQIFNPAGERLGKIPVPETPANVCFGGPAWNELYITARTSVYHVKITATAAGK